MTGLPRCSGRSTIAGALPLSLAGLFAVTSLVAAVAHLVAAPTEAGARARTFAALPDWRGIWKNPWWATTDASGNPPGAEGGIDQFVAHHKLMGPAPYNATWEAKRQALLARMRSSTGPPPAGRACVFSFPGMMESAATLEVLITPEETLILSDQGRARHIYTDGRRHPKKEDLWPTPTGDSVGHWEGTTLVIDTIAHTAGYAGPFPIPGTVELSADAHFIERMRKIDPNTLEDDMTIEDPGRFTRPWQVTLRYIRLAQDRMIAYDCDENDRIQVINGRQTVAPASPY